MIPMLYETNNFNKNNTDLKARSSDGVEFDLHRTLLAVNAGAFPLYASEADSGSRVSSGTSTSTNGSATTTTNGNGSGSGSGTVPKSTNATSNGSTSSNNASTSASASTSTSTSQVIELTEPADVLRICFGFVYPKRHPDMEDVKDFKLIAAVADAVGKYKIYAGVNTCNARLRAFLPEHPIEVFLYAMKYDYLKLMNEAGPYLALSPLIDILKQVPSSYMVPWAQYHEMYSSIFNAAIKKIKTIPASTTGNACHLPASFANTSSSSTTTTTSSQPSFAGFGTPFGGAVVNASATVANGTVGVSVAFPGICSTCRCSALLWLISLKEEVESVKELKGVLDGVLSVALDAARVSGGDGGGKTTYSCCGVTPPLSFGQSPSAFAQAIPVIGPVTASTTATVGTGSSGTSAIPKLPFSFSNSNSTSGTQPTSGSTSPFGFGSGFPGPTSATATASATPTATPAFGPFSPTSTSSNSSAVTVKDGFPFNKSQKPANSTGAGGPVFSLGSTQAEDARRHRLVPQAPVCGHLVNVVKWVKEEIEGVPAFETFIPVGGASGGGGGIGNGASGSGGGGGGGGGGNSGKGGVVRRPRPERG